MPDSWRDCIGQQNCQIYLNELKEHNRMAGTIIIDGVGQDAEIVVNERGGKQSKSPMAMHLVDPRYLADWADDGKETLSYTDSDDVRCVDNCEVYDIYDAIENIAEFMIQNNKCYLTWAMDSIEEDNKELMSYDLDRVIDAYLDEIIEHYEEEITQLQPQSQLAYDDGYQAALEEMEDSIDKIRRFR